MSGRMMDTPGIGRGRGIMARGRGRGMIPAGRGRMPLAADVAQPGFSQQESLLSRIHLGSLTIGTEARDKTSRSQPQDYNAEPRQDEGFYIEENREMPLLQRDTVKSESARESTALVPVYANYYQMSICQQVNRLIGIYNVKMAIGRRDNSMTTPDSSDAKAPRSLTREQKMQLFWIAMKEGTMPREKTSLFWECRASFAFDGTDLLYIANTKAVYGIGQSATMDVEALLHDTSKSLYYNVSINKLGEGNLNSSDLRPNFLRVNTDGIMRDVGPVDLFDAVLRQKPGNFAFPPHGHDMYSMKSVLMNKALFPIPSVNPVSRQPINLSSIVQSWYGQFFVPKLAMNNALMLNVDTTNCVFIKDQSLLEFVCGVLNDAGNDKDKYRVEQLNETTIIETRLEPRLLEHIKGLRVSTSHGGTHRTYRVTGLSRGAAELKFSLRDGIETSVERYFAEQYNYKVLYRHLQMIECGKRGKAQYLPMELCRVYVPQRWSRDLPEDASSNMIRHLCTPAPDRMQRIGETWQGSQLAEQNEWTREYDLVIDPSKMVSIHAHCINPPTIRFQNLTTSAEKGSWNWPSQAQLLNAARIRAYCLLDMRSRPDERECRVTGELLMRRAMSMGMTVDDTYPKMVHHCSLINLRNLLSNTIVPAFNSEGYGFHDFLLIVIMDRRNASTYSILKDMGDKEMGFKTQVLLRNTVTSLGKRPVTVTNIVLKLNVKMGGGNWTTVSPARSSASDAVTNMLYQPGTLVLGISLLTSVDTAHKRAFPHVAAVVGNIDKTMSKWRASLEFGAINMKSKHFISNAIKERIIDLKESNGGVLRRLIVYRDVLTDKDLGRALSVEMQCLEKALADVTDASIPVTLIMCMRRHHSRFFLQDSRQASGKAGNVPPGTLVDTVITNPDTVDFFLCSHFGIQGTSRPTHYYVLHDGNGLTGRDYARITYNLCHVYARCLRAVSLPAPLYYANLVVDRAKMHFHHKLWPTEGTASDEQRSKVKELIDCFQTQSQIEQKDEFKLSSQPHKHSMFWC